MQRKSKRQRIYVNVWLIYFAVREKLGFPGGTSGKEPACQCRRRVRDVGLTPWLGVPLEEEHSNLPQYSYLKNPMDSGAWWAMVYRVKKSLKRLCTHVVEINTTL